MSDDDAAAAEPAREADLPPRLEAARWRRCFALGLFDRPQAAELRGLLRRRYPYLEDEETEGGDAGETPLPAWVRRPVRIVSLEDSIGWLAARVLVVRALAMPDPEMRRAFVHGIRFGQLTGYYLLHEVSVGLLERDVPKAVAVAELAVENVAAHPERQADENADWRALAWAGLGHVRLLAGDRASADAAFVAARAEWETPREKRSPAVEAQICRYESGLRMVQRRFGEAADLLDRAVEQTRRDQDGLHAVCRVERAELARIAGDAATAAEMLREVLGSALPPMRDPSEGYPTRVSRCSAGRGWPRRGGGRATCQDALKQVARDLERIPEEDRDPADEAERGRLEAALRWFQGRREEALALADHSVARERAGGVGFPSRVLLMRAEIRASLCRRELLRGALADLEEARAFADHTWDWEHRALFDVWLLVFGRLGDRKEMATALPEVRRLAEKLDGAFSHRVGWLEGRASQSWKKLWEAREGFLAAGDDLWAARAMLDLLRHLSPDGPPVKEGHLRSLRLASELAAALGAIVESPEGVAVVKILQEQAETGNLTKNILDAAGRVHRQLEDDLRARQALRYAGHYPVALRRG